MTDMLDRDLTDPYTNTVLELAAIRCLSDDENPPSELGALVLNEGIHLDTLSVSRRPPELNSAVNAIQLMVQLEDGIENGGVFRRSLDRVTKVLSRIALRRQLETVTEWEDVVQTIRQIQHE